MKIPHEIITNIYDYDNTYRKYMTENVIPYIHKYIVYKFKTYHSPSLLLIDKETNIAIVTNDFEEPIYKATHYSYDIEIFKNRIKILVASKIIEKFININF